MAEAATTQNAEGVALAEAPATKKVRPAHWMTLKRKALRNMETPYDIFEVEQNATLTEIEAAYFRKRTWLHAMCDDQQDPLSEDQMEYHSRLQTCWDARHILTSLSGTQRGLIERGLRDILDMCLEYRDSRKRRREPWKFLGIWKSASREEVERAYLWLTHVWAPYEDIAGVVMACMEAARDAMLRALATPVEAAQPRRVGNSPGATQQEGPRSRGPSRPQQGVAIPDAEVHSPPAKRKALAAEAPAAEIPRKALRVCAGELLHADESAPSAAEKVSEATKRVPGSGEGSDQSTADASPRGKMTTELEAADVEFSVFRTELKTSRTRSAKV